MIHNEPVGEGGRRVRIRTAIVLCALLLYIGLLFFIDWQFPVVWWLRSLGLVIPAVVCSVWHSVRSKSPEYLVFAMGLLTLGIGNMLSRLDRDTLGAVLVVMAIVFMWTAAIRLWIEKRRKKALSSSN